MWEDWSAAPAGPDRYLLCPASERRGAAVAFCFAGLRRERLLNRAVACGETPEEAGPLLRFFRDRGVPPALDLLPPVPDALAAWLAREGLRPLLQLSVLVKALPVTTPGATTPRATTPGGTAPGAVPPAAERRISPPAPGAPPPPLGPGWGPAPGRLREQSREKVRGTGVEAVGPGQAAIFAATYAAGFGVPPAESLLYQAQATSVVGRPGWRAYLAWFGGEPAGAALLYCAGPVALLAGCGVRPQLRRRGIQAELVRHRLAAAAVAGCHIAVTQTGVGSPSERNMLRLGFTLAYRKSIWGL